MLNLSRLSAFKYDLREIMNHYRVEESAASAMTASVIAKGSRISIDSAKDYVEEQRKTGLYPEGALNEICNLLSQFSKLR